MEDWDDDSSNTAAVTQQMGDMGFTNGGGDYEATGRSFMGRGRGFKPPPRGGGGGGFGGRGESNGFGGGDGFRKRRDDNDNGGEGYRSRRDNDGEGGGFGDGGNRRRRDNDGEGGGFGDGGNRRRRDNDGEGGGFGGGGNDGGEGEGGEKKPPAVSYVPPEPTEDEDEMYSTGISSGINFDKFDDIPVKVTGEDVPPPVKTFADTKLRNFLIEVVAKCGYKKPTPVQKHAIPCIMAGRDVMACAQTGSGKTAAFLLPIVNELLTNAESALTGDDCALPQCVILSPTRELATQIHEESRKFIHGSILKSCVIYGGVQVGHQIRNLVKGAHILVATPGRLLDFLNRGKIDFSAIRFVVLDEADRMLDMGFKGDIDKMMNHTTMVPKTERQTLMFSATFPESIQRMAGDYMKNYLFVTVGTVGGASEDVEQRFIEVTRSDKKKVLLELLAEIGSERTVVFVETKRQADVVSVILSERRIPATSIHGDREQCQREQAIRDFKAGTMHILVATAVASRGLDIKGIKHVINFDLPKDVDEYVHRIGRTGRVGNRGVATSFYDPSNNSDIAPGLVTMLTHAGQEVPDFLKSAGGGCGSYNGNSYGGQDIRGGGAPAMVASEAVADEEW